MDKVLNFIKINESLDSFGMEMSSRTRIKTRNWRNPSASRRYVQLIDLHHKLQWTLTISHHMDKVLNFIKINESEDSFGTEMSSRTRIQTRNWRNPSASRRYVQLSELHHKLPWILTISLHMDKVLNFIKINESLDSFGTGMISRTRIKNRNWRNPSAS